MQPTAPKIKMVITVLNETTTFKDQIKEGEKEKYQEQKRKSAHNHKKLRKRTPK